MSGEEFVEIIDPVEVENFWLRLVTGGATADAGAMAAAVIRLKTRVDELEALLRAAGIGVPPDPIGDHIEAANRACGLPGGEDS